MLLDLFMWAIHYVIVEVEEVGQGTWLERRFLIVSKSIYFGRRCDSKYAIAEGQARLPR